MIPFSMAESENGQVHIVVFANGRLTPPIDDSHPNFKAIVAACQSSMTDPSITTESIADLFDVAATVERKFARLSERVTVENGEVLFDGDPAQPGLSKQIVRFMDEGEDFEPLVKFMENVMQNPQPHSREQAWDWFNNHDFTITEDGQVVIYKGVYSDGKGGYTSGSSGTASVNDVKHTGRIPYAVGDVVTMPRSEVMHDPNAACRAGLHVGTYSYAKGYASGALLRCIVNPRDVVSVPNDANGQKIRVCRFSIDAIIEQQDTRALYRAPVDDPDDSDFADDDEDAGDQEFHAGDYVEDDDGDRGTIVSGPDGDGDYEVEYDYEGYGVEYVHAENLSHVAR